MSELADENEQQPGEEPAEQEPVAEGTTHEDAPRGTAADESGLPSLDDMMEAIRQASVAQLLLSTVSTLASVAYGKLEVRDLPETQRAIDAVGVLLPLLKGQVEDGILRDFEQALTNLKLAYADAVAPAE